MSAELIIVGVVIIAVVLIGMVLVPFLKKKGWINISDVQNTAQLIEIAKLILTNLNVKNDKTQLVLEVTETVVHYVEQTMKYEGNVDKKKYAKDTIKEVLKELDITITPSLDKLIEVTIESTVNKLPDTYGKKYTL